MRIRRLIRNFLWSRKYKVKWTLENTLSHAQSKVKWDVITVLWSKGGLGIIDPKGWREMAKGHSNLVRTWYIPIDTIPPTSSHLRWIGVFSRLEVIMIIKGYFQDRTFWSFDVDNANKLSPYGSNNRLSLCFRAQNNSNRIF